MYGRLNMESLSRMCSWSTSMAGTWRGRDPVASSTRGARNTIREPSRRCTSMRFASRNTPRPRINSTPIARELRLKIAVLGGDHRLDAVQQRGQRRIAAQLDRQGRCTALHAAVAQAPARAAPCWEWCPTAGRSRRPAIRARRRRRESRLWRLESPPSGRRDPTRSRAGRSCSGWHLQPARTRTWSRFASMRRRSSGNTPSCSNTGLSITMSSVDELRMQGVRGQQMRRMHRTREIAVTATRGSCASRWRRPVHPWAAASCSSTGGRSAGSNSTTRSPKVRASIAVRCSASKRDRIFSASAAPVRCMSAARKALSTCLRRSRAISFAHSPASHASRHSSSDSDS